MFVRLSRLLALAAGLAVLSASPTHAALGIDIQPTHVVLPPEKASEILTVTNSRGVATDVRIQAFAWEQSAEDELVLRPSEDIGIAPASLHLAPHESGRVTVTVTAPPGSREKTWRVRIEELPDRAAEAGEEIKMLANVTLPVFRPPAEMVASGVVESAGVSNGRLPISVRNTGNTHVFVNAVSVTGLDAAGKEVFSISDRGWYLLAGASRRFDATVSGNDCRRLAGLQVRARMMDGNEWQGMVTPDKRQCGTGGRTEFPPPPGAVAPTVAPPHAEKQPSR